MAIAYNIHGGVTVKYDGVNLGYTRNGVSVRINPRFKDYKIDHSGGDEGIPDESQFLGATADISIELEKYDRDPAEILTSFNQGGAAGIHANMGALVKGDSLYAVLDLVGATHTIRFPVAVIKGGQELSFSLRASMFMVRFECWPDDYSGTKKLFERIVNA